MRHFVNRLPDFVPNSPVQIDKIKWRDNVIAIVKSILERMGPSPTSCDGGLYVGNVGVAYMLYYLSKHSDFESQRHDYIEAGIMYLKTNLDFQKRGGFSNDPPCSFILGPAGVAATCSLLYKETGDVKKSDMFVHQFVSLMECCKKIDFFRHGSDELLVGRAGYMSGVLALQQKLGRKILSEDQILSLCKVVVESGKLGAQKRRSKPKAPLMYSYYGTEYLGAAHGLSSILQMLLSFPEFLAYDLEAADKIKQSVDFMLSLKQSNHNYPPAMDEVGTRRPEDHELVHWCHGAPGIVYLFARAFKVWGDQKYLDACLQCGEVTWQFGLLRKGPGICHGVAGSGYVFLLLYRLTGDHKHLHRAQQFAEFLFTEEFQRGARVPDSPYSLYEGWAGTVCFLADLLQPDRAEFPLFNVIFKEDTSTGEE